MRPSPRRIQATLACAFACAVLATALVTPGAGAANLDKAQHNLDAAQSQADQLGKDISHEKDRLATLQGDVAGLEGEISLAQAEYDHILARLNETRTQLDSTQGRYDDVKAVMDDRAAQTYMLGPGNSLDFLLSASSIADLSARAEFIGALQAQDSDHAAQLTSLSRQLNDTRKRQTDLTQISKDALAVLEKRKADLESRKAEVESTLASLNAKLAEAKKLEEKWSHKVRVILSATGGTGGPSPFTVCPVPNYSWIADDFGAVRYTTVPPHAHQGNDIGGPYGTPIVAPFSGIASNASNSLGGLSVYVKSSAGYVYNAHLSKMGQLGRVQAGDIVGYLGMSGDAQGTVPHDHFEWHPGGGSAVDPHEFLMAVC
jgi:murein DD-endopeptidase MepM/ murein hydrolase activator NlpD